ncbi:MAG: hypothetical protein K0S16_496 [Moraxellaceae bacterium]|jgi:hypothetical protein|nr:hypothetical protein [Moraxellaceae bacterium]
MDLPAMGYKKPEEVVSPKGRWEYRKTLCNTGQDGFSVVEGIWDERPVVAIRWNGDDLSGSSGAPQSTGWPTWFILPAELQEAVKDKAVSLNSSMHCLRCDLVRPPGADWGIFKVEVEVIDPELKDCVSSGIVKFDLPHLPNRLFRAWTEQFDEYFSPPTEMGAQWQGKLTNGYWVGIVQTNGIPEDKNETTRAMVRDALVEKVAGALAPFQEAMRGQRL